MSFVLESGCKGIAFWLTNQIFSQKSCLKTRLFNICLQLVRIKLLIYLIKYTHAGAWVCTCTYTQITCMAGDAVHGTRILSFWTRILSSRTLILFFTNTNFIFFEHEFNELNESLWTALAHGTGRKGRTRISLSLIFLMRGRIDEMKRIFRKRTFSWKTDGVFMRRNVYLCKTEGGNE